MGDERIPDLGAHRVQADCRERIERDFVFDLRVEDALLLALAAYIVVDAGRRLLGFGAEARESTVGTS